MYRLFAAFFFLEVAQGSDSLPLECLQKCVGFEKGGSDFVAVYDDWPKPSCEWWSEAAKCADKCSQDDTVVKWVVQEDLPEASHQACSKDTSSSYFGSLFKYLKAVKAAVPTSECASIEIRTPDDFCESSSHCERRLTDLTAAGEFAGQVLKMTDAFNQNGRWFIYPMPQTCVKWITDMHIDDEFGVGEIDID